MQSSPPLIVNLKDFLDQMGEQPVHGLQPTYANEAKLRSGPWSTQPANTVHSMPAPFEGLIPRMASGSQTEANGSDGGENQDGWSPYQSDEESRNVPSRVGSEDGYASPCSSETLPVKATFIHFDMSSYRGDDETPQSLCRSASSPSILLESPFVVTEVTEQFSVRDAHELGTCKPCAYFALKEDGCRWGDDCEYCHICPAGELKKRRKAKAKAERLADLKSRGTAKSACYGRRPPWWTRKNAKKP